jgi:hypothetical protein
MAPGRLAEVTCRLSLYCRLLLRRALAAQTWEADEPADLQKFDIFVEDLSRFLS